MPKLILALLSVVFIAACETTTGGTADTIDAQEAEGIDDIAFDGPGVTP